MNRIVGLALAMVLALGSVTTAGALDINVKGYFDFAFGWYTNTDDFHDSNSNGDFGSEENFDAEQRLRLQIDFVASENLSGTLQLEIGDISWGSGGGDTWAGSGYTGQGSGGAMGTDGVNVETKHMYIDWIVPETDLMVRMGLQPFALPVFASGAESGNAILDDDMAGIVLNYEFNEYVAVNLAWLRPWNPFARSGESNWNDDSRYHHDNIDLFALTLPLTFADYGLEIVPWAVYGSIGEVDNTEDYDNHGGDISSALAGSRYDGESWLGDDGKVWWAGISFNVEYWDPFFFAADFMYGKYSSDDASIFDSGGAYIGDYDNDRSGWAVSAMLGYRLECLTPTLFGWYGSGMDDPTDENGLDGLMPVLSPDFGFTSLGWGNNFDLDLFREGAVNGNNIIGTWGIGIGLEDISLVENMTNAVRVAYFRGTNDEDLARLGSFWDRDLGMSGGYAYTSKDYGLEVNLDTTYEIMEGLTLYNQISYVHLDIDDSWNEDRTVRWDNDTDDIWAFSLGFRYAF